MVYLTGEPKVSEGIESSLRSNLGMTVKPLDFSNFMKVQVAGFSKSKNESRARRLAPEIGIAWQQCQPLKHKAFLNYPAIDELTDDLD
jgi:hypothetical protein